MLESTTSASIGALTPAGLLMLVVLMFLRGDIVSRKTMERELTALSNSQNRRHDAVDTGYEIVSVLAVDVLKTNLPGHILARLLAEARRPGFRDGGTCRTRRAKTSPVGKPPPVFGSLQRCPAPGSSMRSRKHQPRDSGGGGPPSRFRASSSSFWLRSCPGLPTTLRRPAPS